MKLLVVTICLALTGVLALPIDDSAMSLVEEEIGITPEEIEQRTKTELQALDVPNVAKEGALSTKKLTELKSDLQQARDAAKKVAKKGKAMAAEADALSKTPDKAVDAELAEAKMEAKRLMAAKAAARLEEQADKKVLDDAKFGHDSHDKKHWPETLGESYPTAKPITAEGARLKAAEWNEGKRLAEKVKQLQGGAKNNEVAGNNAVITAAGVTQHGLTLTEKTDLLKAKGNEAKIDAAGFALNSWYDANNHGELGATDLGQGQSPLSPEQQKIQDKALATIKKVQAAATAAIQNAANTPASTSNAGYPKPYMRPVDAASGLKTKLPRPSKAGGSKTDDKYGSKTAAAAADKTADGTSYRKMEGVVHKDMLDVANQATLDAKAQKHLLQMITKPQKGGSPPLHNGA